MTPSQLYNYINMANKDYYLVRNSGPPHFCSAVDYVIIVSLTDDAPYYEPERGLPTR